MWKTSPHSKCVHGHVGSCRTVMKVKRGWCTSWYSYMWTLRYYPFSLVRFLYIRREYNRPRTLPLVPRFCSGEGKRFERFCSLWVQKLSWLKEAVRSQGSRPLLRYPLFIPVKGAEVHYYKICRLENSNNGAVCESGEHILSKEILRNREILKFWDNSAVWRYSRRARMWAYDSVVLTC